MRPEAPLLAVGLLVSLLFAPPLLLDASADDETEGAPTTRIAEATRVAEGPIVDGRIDDDIWDRAQILSGFIQAEPLNGEPESERTEVRLLYTNEIIYVGAVMYDSDPSGIVVSDARRDSELNETDAFQVIFDTYHDRQNGFVFGTNPAGLEYDGQVANEGEGSGGRGGGPGLGAGRSQSGAGGGFNLNWDASWTVATSRGDYGWSAEFAIPLRSLRLRAGKPQTWGLNFQRSIRRKREIDYWSPVDRIFNLYRLSMAGELRNLELETPRNFKVTPYVISSADRNFSVQDETDLSGDIGVDAKYGVTPSLNLDLTYNTDFAQVEVDAQQVNLTRFNLFFPEKRPFFLENAGNFTMGQSQAVELFFSRRIGISDVGAPVPILGGARLSGKSGAYNVGFLNMQTESQGNLAANNYTVASLSRELGGRSSIGAVFVNRMGTGDLSGDNDWNRTWGVDGKWGVGQSLTFTGFAARTETPDVTGSEHAANIRAEYQRLGGRVWLGYTEVGESFNPEVGFLRRREYRNLDTGWFINKRLPNIAWLRELRPHVTYRGFWDFNGFKQTENVHIDSHIDFENGYYFSPAFNMTVEGFQQGFQISDGVFVLPGSYRNWEAAWRWNTNLGAPISYSGGMDSGGFLSGDRTSVDTTVNVRQGTKLITSLTWSYNDIRLAEGAFTTNLIQARVAYNFTPLINIQSLIQYNDDADVWSSNIRFNWLNTAGTGLFVVYNDTEGLGNLLIGPQNRSFIVKYTRQFDVLR